VLICLRDFQDDKADIIHKYTPSEAIILKEQGEFDPEAITTVVQRDVMSMEDIVNEAPVLEENKNEHDFIDFSTI
jgi:translation initiation factor 1A